MSPLPRDHTARRRPGYRAPARARGAAVLLAASFVIACRPSGGDAPPDLAPQCQPTYPADYCPAQPEEVKCWGAGDGCGAITPSPAQREACAVKPPCDRTTPLPGAVWPSRVRTLECGKGFGNPWCFSNTWCPTNGGLCPFHSGIDLAIRPGSPIYAIHAGTIVNITPREAVGMGVMIVHDIPGAGVFTSVYSHLDSFDKQIGDTVCTGERLGFSAQFACPEQMFNSLRSHVHFSLWRGEPDLENTWMAWVQAPICGEQASAIGAFPAQYVDPECYLGDAPLPSDPCFE